MRHRSHRRRRRSRRSRACDGVQASRGKNSEIKDIFPSSHEALVDSSGRADAATAERGDDHRGKDSQPGQECQPTLLKRGASLGCPPRRRQTNLLVSESAPFAAEARGLHKGRHRLMTVERQLPSMHWALGSPSYGRSSTPMTPWTGGFPPRKGLPEHTVCQQRRTRTNLEHHRNCRRGESHA